ncbi:MAG: hypothetical protein V3W41_01610 [Planctomycetota bacterium]
MAKGKRRSAVDEVQGSDSPVSLKMRAQQAAARKAREEDGVGETPEVSPVATQRKPLTGEETAAPRSEERRPKAKRRVMGAAGNGKVVAERGKKKQKPAKRIPVTGNEGDVWEGACRTMSACVGAKVTFAAASRAIWSMVVEIEGDLDRFEAPQLEKPAHADAVANADFEDQLRGFLLEVLQKSKRH